MRENLRAIRPDVRAEPDGVVVLDIPLFREIDAYGTGWRPGVFDEWLRENRPKIVGWDHDSGQRFGVVSDWTRTNDGYRITARFNLDAPVAAEAFSMISFNLENGAPDDWSFRFEPLDMEVEDGVDYFKRAKVYEFSPVLVGAVPGTATVGARSEPADDGDNDPAPLPDVIISDLSFLEVGARDLSEAVTADYRIAVVFNTRFPDAPNAPTALSGLSVEIIERMRGALDRLAALNEQDAGDDGADNDRSADGDAGDLDDNEIAEAVERILAASPFGTTQQED